MKNKIPGHKYETSDGQIINFKLGNYDGITTEELIDILVDRLSFLQSQQADHYTFQAICDCTLAKRRLLNRAITRNSKGITGTNIPTVDYKEAAKYAASTLEDKKDD